MSDQTQTNAESVEQVAQETTSAEASNKVSREHLLCRVVDVELSLLGALRRFVEEEKSSLEDMMNLMREELSKMELFAPKFDDNGDAVELKSSASE